MAVDPLGPELAAEGLSTASVQARVEERLRRAGVTVDPGAPEFVGFRMLAASARRGPMAVCVEIGLYQAVTLNRDKATRTVTATWGAQSVVLTPPNEVNASSGDTVDELVDRFAAAYRAGNPR